MSDISNNKNDNDDMTRPLYRSSSSIARLVQKRVLERDAFLVNGVEESVVPSSKEMLKFFGGILPQYFKFKPPPAKELDKLFPVLDMDWNKLDKGQNQATWMGHASLLIQLEGCNILTDPVFSDRCSASQWVGPKRYRKPPCTIQELCANLKLDLVLISHNHYDHLDYQTVKDIYKYASDDVLFIVPLGLRQWLHSTISKNLKAIELDWHESWNCSSTEMEITSVPMRHWTNRKGPDRDRTLWCGYTIQTKSRNVLFPGDTAWFDDLQTMGPFDFAAIPIGAYEPRDFMKKNHINVSEAVQMKDAIQARKAVPIHWGTFPLTVEPVMEPAEKLRELMSSRPDADSFVPWMIGETNEF